MLFNMGPKQTDRDVSVNRGSARMGSPLAEALKLAEQLTLARSRQSS
jgi:hypothetical protein